MPNLFHAVLHESLAQTAGLQLSNDSVLSAVDLILSTTEQVTSRYAKVGSSAEFAREKKIVLAQRGIGSFDGESNLDEVLKQESIFDILGQYFPERRQVVLYTNVIKYIAEDLSIDKKILTEIVLVHEIAHAVTHFGVDEKGGIWQYFAAAPAEHAELLAQLLSFIVFRELGMDEHIEVMRLLGEYQPPEYNSYLEHESNALISAQLLMRIVRLPWRAMVEVPSANGSSVAQRMVVHSDGKVFHLRNNLRGESSHLSDFFEVEKFQHLARRASEGTLFRIKKEIAYLCSLQPGVGVQPPSSSAQGGTPRLLLCYKGDVRNFDLADQLLEELKSLLDVARREAKTGGVCSYE